MNVYQKHLQLYFFDAGRTGLFPSFSLLLGRPPAIPVAQGSPPNPALGCGCGRRHYPVPRGARERAGDMRRQYRRGLASNGSPAKSKRPQVSWWRRSVIDGDGRRFIKLWRSPSVDRGQSRVVHRQACLKLCVQFAPEEAPVVLRFEARSGCSASVIGAAGRWLLHPNES